MEQVLPEKQQEKSILAKRISAGIIDCVILPSFIIFVFRLLLIFQPPAFSNFAVLGIAIIWFSFKDLLFEGCAPGKKIFGLRVISKATGQKITARQGFIRNVLLFVPLVALIGFPLELIVLLAKKERFGDVWAGTEVIAL
jgi:uncharacterized RDD family membrane protein YckC